MKRVAICLSGECRTWNNCIENIKTFFKNDEEFQFHYFIHTWDNNIFYKSLYGNSDLDQKIDIFFNSNPKHYVESYQPKLYKIQNFESYYKNLKSHLPKLSQNCNLFHLFYSFKQSLILKKIWERKEKIKYDYVVKIRPDIIFLNQSFKKHISLLENSDKKSFITYYGYENNWKNNLDDFWGADIYWIFKNDDADIFSSYYADKINYEKVNNKSYTQNRHTFNKLMNPINLTHKVVDNIIFIIRPWYSIFINDFKSIDTLYKIEILNLIFSKSHLDKNFVNFVIEKKIQNDLNHLDIFSFFKKHKIAEEFVKNILNKSRL